MIEQATVLYEPRCGRCGKKLAERVQGCVLIVCGRCKTANTLDSAHLTNRPTRVTMGQARMLAAAK